MAVAASPPGLVGAPRADDLAGVEARRGCEVWYALALAAGLLFAIGASAPALRDRYVVNDDVRQHVFWVVRLHDPDLFRDDPIADYYAAQAPPGFVAVYFVGTLLVDPLTLSKLLPLALTCIASSFAFLFGLRISGRPIAATLGAALLTWSIWQYDDIPSATPRSFAIPLLVAFLAFLAADRWRPGAAGERAGPRVDLPHLACVLTIGLQALTYPIGCAVMLAVYAAWLTPRARERPRAALWLIAATALAAGLTLLGQRPAAPYGPVISADAARQIDDFRPGGRSSYFIPDPVKFWLESTRSGLSLAPKDPLLGGLPVQTLPFGLAAALGLWVLLGRLGLIGRPQLPREAALLPILAAVSLVLFFAAHALLFRLYLPARYVQFSLPVVWALGGGLAVALATERLAARIAPQTPARAAAALALGALILLAAHAPPPGASYVVGQHPRLYEYLREQPKDTLIAALPHDASNLPLFAERPVLTSWEHALPYHPTYHEPFQQRTRALLRAYYAESPRPLVELARREGVGIIVANLAALERRRLVYGDLTLGLDTLVERCAALRERELVAIPVSCATRVVR
jgi:hypothetical protein